ncbi:hypothetical protein R4P64_31945 [Rhodococcus sp. IEGM 1366]|uniref:hypothetical protein n=1 Tax=Rhodococcus sp. IEGM 1366 TaxID=3082223 RepID=UPI0029543CFC|nr:hypothetical protein [Rhodococcus sp. IEGM 1366]MDV8071134.1 hypothetical protein [Rhodococcus sp. IEGM 1366]
MPPPDTLSPAAKAMLKTGIQGTPTAGGLTQYIEQLEERRRWQKKAGAKEPDQTVTELIALAEQRRAEKLIATHYYADGGPLNSVGQPMGNGLQIHVTRNGDEFGADFRSGHITFLNDGPETVSQTVTELNVEFVGLECVSRQEKMDEVFGVVSAVGPANSTQTTHAFPGNDNKLDMGPGLRIRSMNQKLYQGPVEDVVLMCSLIEHDDFADIEGTSKQIADKMVEVGGQVVGGLTGVPAESVTDETWFRDGAAFVVGFVMGDVFGAGDDPYGAQALKIPWTSVLPDGPPRQPPRTRADDGGRIPLWTHSVLLTGVDDNNDVGRYNFYFDCHLEEVHRKSSKSVV